MNDLLAELIPRDFLPWVVAIALNTLLATIAWIAPKKLLTSAGLAHAWFLGVMIWGTLGWQGYGIIMVYFLAGSAVTRVGMKEKEAAGIAEKRSGARGPENVWGSALVGTLCAIAIFMLSMTTVAAASSWIAALWLGYVASLSTKLSDTSASEIGKAYGQRTFLITTLKPVPRGTEGAVSLEGTLAGIVASVAIALVGWLVGVMSPLGIGICVLAAFVATNLESVIGATLQEQIDWLTNEIVNIINTLIGASVAVGLFILGQAL
ncbi:MAG: TIGR00297 family protein [Cyanobacteria bacterium P01_A01_bin.37]